MNREENFDKVLSQHKIDKVSFYRFRARYPRLHGKNARLSYHGFGGEVTVAKVCTDQGRLRLGRAERQPSGCESSGGAHNGKVPDGYFFRRHGYSGRYAQGAGHSAARPGGRDPRTAGQPHDF